MGQCAQEARGGSAQDVDVIDAEGIVGGLANRVDLLGGRQRRGTSDVVGFAFVSGLRQHRHRRRSDVVRIAERHAVGKAFDHLEDWVVSRGMFQPLRWRTRSLRPEVTAKRVRLPVYSVSIITVPKRGN
jgi:hypothetical protein